MADEQNPLVCLASLQDPSESSCPEWEQNSSDGDESVALVAEQLGQTGLQTEDGQDGDVECDSCTASKEKAKRTCLVCLASYCETHLRMHNDLNAGKAHLLVDATGGLRGKMCTEHHKLLEVYCRTDRQCICCLCMLDVDHRGHDMVSVATERAEKQRQLEMSERMVTDRETELKEIRKAAGNLRNLTQATEEEGDRIFTELLGFMRRSHTEMITLVQTQMTTELDRIQGHLESLKQEISELKTKRSELEELSRTDDHIHFLQEVQSRWPMCTDFPSLTTNQQFSFGEMIKSLTSLSVQIQDFWRLEMTRIFSAVTAEKILLPLEPKTREEFLQFFVPLRLDANTAHRNLWLTEQNRTVACSIEPQSYPKHPDRFEWWAQVLSDEGLTGRCYWEVIWTGGYGVDIAVSNKDINRTGQEDNSGFGYNTHSWSLDCSMFRYTLVHNNEEMEIPVPPSHWIGVYLDHRAGLLSFYSVSDTMILLQRVQTRFPKPLYPGFGLFQGSTARFCNPQEGVLAQVADRPNNNKTCSNQRYRRHSLRKSKYFRSGK